MLPTPVEKFVFAILFSRTSHGTSLSFLEEKKLILYVHISTRKRDLLGWVYTAGSGQANSGHLHPGKTENLLAMFRTMLNGTGGGWEDFWRISGYQSTAEGWRRWVRMPLVDGNSNSKRDALSGGRKGNATKLSLWSLYLNFISFKESLHSWANPSCKCFETCPKAYLWNDFNITIKNKHCSL